MTCLSDSTAALSPPVDDPQISRASAPALPDDPLRNGDCVSFPMSNKSGIVPDYSGPARANTAPTKHRKRRITFTIEPLSRRCSDYHSQSLRTERCEVLKQASRRCGPRGAGVGIEAVRLRVIRKMVGAVDDHYSACKRHCEGLQLPDIRWLDESLAVKRN